VSEPPDIGRLFGTVADLYDEVRPDYPDAVYDTIEQTVGRVEGMRVVDLAAGTGIQTRALARRGAHLVAIDPDLGMLRRLHSTASEIPAVAGRAEQIPLRADRADLVVCATAWHWLRAEQAVAEIRRVIRPGGHFALWWGINAWGDGVDWEDAQSAVFDRWDSVRGSVPPRPGGVGPREAADDLRSRGIDVVVDREFTWSREVTREQHMRMMATHSNNLARPEAERREILAEIEAALQPWPVVTERLWGPLVIACLAKA
jgi:SAM-dependent methyltransferase